MKWYYVVWYNGHKPYPALIDDPNSAPTIAINLSDPQLADVPVFLSREEAEEFREMCTQLEHDFGCFDPDESYNVVEEEL